MVDNSKKEIGLIAALTCEASPIIKALDLKPISYLSGFSLYRGEGTTLVISGIGSENSAAATNYLMGHTPSIKSIINFGICGATSNFKKATIVTPSKIVNLSTQDTFFPEILVKGGAIGTLGTADETVTSPMNDVDFYDMEGAGIYAAAIRYLIPSFLKVVSDNLTDLPQTKDEVTTIINSQKDHILSFIQLIRELPILEPTLQELEIQALERIQSLGKLTVSQERLLRSLAIDFKYRGGDLSPLLRQFDNKLQTLKGDSTSRDIFFSELTNVLKSD